MESEGAGGAREEHLLDQTEAATFVVFYEPAPDIHKNKDCTKILVFKVWLACDRRNVFLFILVALEV